CQHSHGLPPTF
nr:immunoglobulin light chain junction region [Macaca mulatta]